ncbi:MAG: hypothetical protein DCC71_11330 [Proteobacteria bacterium]|nr:MAG: hypothetical protein DCC71_11330 [Pseudomonadota bacterium]
MAVPSLFRSGYPFATGGDPAWPMRSIERLFEDLWRAEAPVATPRFAPRLEVVEHENEFVVTAELPGLEEKDFDVEVHGNVVAIHGEKRSERSGEAKGRAWSERSYGEFRRVIELPTEIDGDKASASFKNGVLAVTIPKSEASKVRHIPVTAA